MDLVLTGHILSATMAMLNIKEIDEFPSCLSTNLEQESFSTKKSTLNTIVHEVVDRFVNIELYSSHSQENAQIDEVYEYARETLSLLLLRGEFQDAIREGDGERVLRVWKFLLIIFKASNKVNYSIEALNFLAQYYILLPPRLRQQLIWSRFINTHGKQGKNIPCDLHLEHLNRSLKTTICNLGPNVVPKAIQRASRCIGDVISACHNYDRLCGIHPASTSHSSAKIEKDIKVVVNELVNTSKVFQHTAKQSHSSCKVKGSLLRTVDKQKLSRWMKERLAIISSH